jgi:catechol 2,3-dioxygenase-like lactoylglutathione lyase family enzyme
MTVSTQIPPIGSISRVMLFVRDVAEVAAFYRDTLGLQPLGKITPEWVEMKAGGCTIALHRVAKPLRQRGSASAKIVFGVKDVDSTRSLLESRGVTMGKVHSFSGIKICNGEDPEGNPFQISSRGM